MAGKKKMGGFKVKGASHEKEHKTKHRRAKHRSAGKRRSHK